MGIRRREDRDRGGRPAPLHGQHAAAAGRAAGAAEAAGSQGLGRHLRALLPVEQAGRRFPGRLSWPGPPSRIKHNAWFLAKR